MNKARPMASGAMKDVRLFTTASMMIVMTSSPVSMASMKKPWAGVVLSESVFEAWSSLGKTPETSPAAAMPPAI